MKDKSIFNENFLLQELKIRAEIKRKSKEFENAIDTAKAREIKRIDEIAKQREIVLKQNLEELEKALSSNDNEQIKIVLKKLQI